MIAGRKYPIAKPANANHTIKAGIDKTKQQCLYIDVKYIQD